MEFNIPVINLTFSVTHHSPPIENEYESGPRRTSESAPTIPLMSMQGRTQQNLIYKVARRLVEQGVLLSGTPSDWDYQVRASVAKQIFTPLQIMTRDKGEQ